MSKYKELTEGEFLNLMSQEGKKAQEKFWSSEPEVASDESDDDKDKENTNKEKTENEIDINTPEFLRIT